MTVVEGVVLVLVFSGGVSIVYSTVRYHAPPWPSSKRMRRSLLDAALKGNTPVKILEAGAGWGGLSVLLARAFPASHVMAAEVSLAPFLFLWVRAQFYPNLTVHFQDAGQLIQSDKPDLIVTYVSHPVMVSLVHQVPEGHDMTWISLHFSLPGYDPTDTAVVQDMWRTPLYTYRLTGSI